MNCRVRDERQGNQMTLRDMRPWRPFTEPSKKEVMIRTEEDPPEAGYLICVILRTETTARFSMDMEVVPVQEMEIVLLM